jgi:2-polyprenyl-3-methyl-5-hydroxy-6-metoxy-1,4-benzoquinol methylase
VIRGTQGYAEQVDELVERYEAMDFADKHEAVLHLLPETPGRALDIGAGSGVDAAWLAQKGYRVAAVEPMNEFRSRAMALHPSPSIEWIDDSLPRLELILGRKQRFNLVMLTAVWMHLDQEERRLAMPNVASLLEPNGILLMSLRHGPVPKGRIMYEVSAEETIALAQASGLHTVLSVLVPSAQGVNREAGIMWSRLAFVRAATGQEGAMSNIA